MSAPDNTDKGWMQRALALARRAWGRTSPNPLVGAVVVREGVVLGRGYHRQAGTPHAEIHALAAAGTAAAGATLYVTLEPCSTTGRTPPCTDAICQAKLKRVVIGCLDPNPKHAGRGVRILQNAGIQTTVGVLEERCRTLNEAFFCWIREQRPFVLLKMAMTLDGRIATAAGESRWITGARALAQVQRLRQWADAVMVGAETVRRDNPALTVRRPRNWPRQPRRLVWTRKRALPGNLRLWDRQDDPPRLVAPDTPAEWRALLHELGRQQITALLVEGGGELAAACLRAGIVDKVAFFVAPKILGGRGSRPVVGGPNPKSLDDALPLSRCRSERVGTDLLITGYLSNVHRTD